MVNEDQELMITTKRNYKEDMRPFSMVGVINHKDVPGADWVDALLSLSRASAITFKEMKRNRCKETNLVMMSEWEDLDNDKKRPINHKINELKKAGLILRVKPIKNILSKCNKNTFIINPYVFKPRQYSSACLIWRELGGVSEEAFNS